MSSFRVNIVAANIKDDQRTTPPIEALVDAGSELTWLPADVLQAAGIVAKRNLSFQTATSQTVVRPIGYAILRAEGFETIDEVVFAEPGDMSLLGVRTLEGFSVMVDNIAHRFVARTTIVAGNRECNGCSQTSVTV
jgi:predicted aspartyl protease